MIILKEPLDSIPDIIIKIKNKIYKIWNWNYRIKQNHYAKIRYDEQLVEQEKYWNRKIIRWVGCKMIYNSLDFNIYKYTYFNNIYWFELLPNKKGQKMIKQLFFNFNPKTYNYIKFSNRHIKSNINYCFQYNNIILP